jgi:hypothetical protein
MRRAMVFAALVAVVVGTPVLAGALDGDPPAQTGWWSQDATASAQPDGGFQVEALAGQAISVAAVRFSTPSGVTSATLSLQESGGFVTDDGALQVCPTHEPWEPANPGAAEDAPTPDCTTAAALSRDADAAVWTASVAPLLPALGGDASLMIVPVGTGDESPLDAYQVTFSAAALAVTAAPGTTASPSTTAYVAPAPSGGGTTPSGGSPSFAAPGPTAATTPTTLAPATPLTSPADNTQTATDAFQPPSLSAGATPGGGGADQPWERLLVLVPLSAIIGVAIVYARRQLEQRGVLEEGA